MSHVQTGCFRRFAEKLDSFGGCGRQPSSLAPGWQAGGGPSSPGTPAPCPLARACARVSLPLSQKVQTQSQVYCFYLVYFKYSFTLYYML